MSDKSAPEQIDDIVKKYGGWKGEILSLLRESILAADSGAVEEVKWRMATRPEGLPVWSHSGIICLAETFKNDIKLVFVKGARMSEYKNYFNTRLNSKTDRAIEFHDGDAVDKDAIKALVKEAVRLNTSKYFKQY